MRDDRAAAYIITVMYLFAVDPGFPCDGFTAPRAGLPNQVNSVADPLPAAPLPAIACHRRTAEHHRHDTVVTWI